MAFVEKPFAFDSSIQISLQTERKTFFRPNYPFELKKNSDNRWQN